MSEQHVFKPPPFDVQDNLCRRYLGTWERGSRCYKSPDDPIHCPPSVSEDVKQEIRNLLHYASGDDPDAAEVIRRANKITRLVSGQADAKHYVELSEYL